MLDAVFGSVAMVNVEVENCNSLKYGGIVGSRVSCGNGDVVEETESLTDVAVVGVVNGTVGANVMARRSNAAEGVSVTLLGYCS